MACISSICGTCVGGVGCAFCSLQNVCLPATSQDFGSCTWDEVHFLKKECPEESLFAVLVGVAAGLVAIFIIWMIWRGWTSKARHGLKNSAGMEAAYKNAKVVDAEYKDISLAAFAIDRSLPSWGFGKQYQWSNFWYYVGCVSSMYYIWGLLSDGLAFRSMYATGRQSEAVFYAATVVISLILIAYDIYQAHHILRLDDISDGFLNADVMRYRSLKKMQYVFLKKLQEGVKCADKVALFLFNGLIKAPRLAFVELPQLVLVIVSRAKNDASVQDRCAINFADPLCYSSACDKCLDDHGPDILSTIGLSFKGIFLGIALVQFGVALFLYPCVRGIIQLKFSKLGGEKFTLTGYCSYLIDVRICELLVKTPNAVPADFWEKRGRTADGEKKTLSEQASEIKQAAIVQVQETRAAAIAQVVDTKEKIVETKERMIAIKQEGVESAIEMKENAQDKYTAGKDAVKNVFSAGKGVLNVLVKKEGDASS